MTRAGLLPYLLMLVGSGVLLGIVIGQALARLLP